MPGEDDHEDCVRCLGLDHAEDAFDRPERCSICADTPRANLSRRLKRVRDFFPREARDRDRERADIDADERHRARSPSRYSESDYVNNPSLETAQRAVTAASANGAPEEEEFDGSHSPPRQRPEAWADEMDSQDLPAAQAAAPVEDAESMEEDGDEEASSIASDDSSSSASSSTPERRGGRFDEAPAPQEQPAAAVIPPAAHVVVPPAAHVEVEVAAAPVVEPQAIAQAPPPLARDDAPLMDVFKRGAMRANLVWPTEQARDEEDTTMWDSFDEEAEPDRATQFLPLVKGFDRVLTASWRTPFSFVFPPGHKQSYDAAGMSKVGLTGMPHMHHRIAGHLLRQSFSSKKEPTFSNVVDKDNSRLTTLSTARLRQPRRLLTLCPCCRVPPLSF